jgi:hypothetical protein
MHLNNLIPANACGESRRWLATLAEGTTPQQAWDACARGDWMLWLLGMRGPDRRALILCTCEIARQALNHVPVGEVRPLRAIEMAEAWARGEATIQRVRITASDAANAAACATFAGAAAAGAAAYAAFGGADAASRSADAAANAAAAVADAADDASNAACAAANAAAYTAADYAAARSASLQASANIVRKHFPQPPRKDDPCT